MKFISVTIAVFFAIYCVLEIENAGTVCVHSIFANSYYFFLVVETRRKKKKNHLIDEHLSEIFPQRSTGIEMHSENLIYFLLWWMRKDFRKVLVNKLLFLFRLVSILDGTFNVQKSISHSCSHFTIQKVVYIINDHIAQFI